MSSSVNSYEEKIQYMSISRYLLHSSIAIMYF